MSKSSLFEIGRRTFPFAMGLALVSAIGCAPTMHAALSTHTVQVGPEQSTDVVWIEDSHGTVYRCTGANGPSCQPAQGLR
jgi:hypothetical protein